MDCTMIQRCICSFHEKKQREKKKFLTWHLSNIKSLIKFAYSFIEDTSKQNACIRSVDLG